MKRLIGLAALGALAIPAAIAVAKPLAKKAGKGLKKFGAMVDDAIDDMKEAFKDRQTTDVEEVEISEAEAPAEAPVEAVTEAPATAEEAAVAEPAPKVEAPAEEPAAKKPKAAVARKPKSRDKAAKQAKDSPKRTGRRSGPDIETG